MGFGVGVRTRILEEGGGLRVVGEFLLLLGLQLLVGGLVEAHPLALDDEAVDLVRVRGGLGVGWVGIGLGVGVGVGAGAGAGAGAG